MKRIHTFESFINSVIEEKSHVSENKPVNENTRKLKKEIQNHLDQFYGGNIDGNDLANAIEEIIKEAKLSEEDEIHEDEIEIKVDGDLKSKLKKKMTKKSLKKKLQLKKMKKQKKA